MVTQKWRVPGLTLDSQEPSISVWPFNNSGKVRIVKWSHRNEGFLVWPWIPRNPPFLCDHLTILARSELLNGHTGMEGSWKSKVRPWSDLARIVKWSHRNGGFLGIQGQTMVWPWIPRNPPFLCDHLTILARSDHGLTLDFQEPSIPVWPFNNSDLARIVKWSHRNGGFLGIQGQTRNPSFLCDHLTILTLPELLNGHTEMEGSWESKVRPGTLHFCVTI